MSLHCFHGFLGKRADFDFLEEPIAYDLYSLCKKSKDECLNSLDEKTKMGDSLLGYSFGGRLAMQLFLMNPDKYKTCIILSSHCGLKDKTAKMQRVLFDQKCADKIRELSEEEFLNGWNAQALFKEDPAIPEFPIKDKEGLTRFFTEYGLSTQDYLIDELLKYLDKLVFIYGKRDSKYYDYSKQNIENLGFKTFHLDGGHRLLKTHQNEILKLVNSHV